MNIKLRAKKCSSQSRYGSYATGIEVKMQEMLITFSTTKGLVTLQIFSCAHEMQNCKIILPTIRYVPMPFMVRSNCTLESIYCGLESFFR